MPTTATHNYAGLKHIAASARDSADYRVRLGIEYDAILSLIAENELLRQQAPPVANVEPAAEPLPAEPRKRVPTIFPMSPAAERHRQQMRDLISSTGLAMDTRPDGLIHISGFDVDLLVRDLVNVIPSDFVRGRH